MKRFLTAFAVFLFAAVALFGCAGDPSGGEGKRRLKVVVGKDAETANGTFCLREIVVADSIEFDGEIIGNAESGYLVVLLKLDMLDWRLADLGVFSAERSSDGESAVSLTYGFNGRRDRLDTSLTNRLSCNLNLNGAAGTVQGFAFLCFPLTSVEKDFLMQKTQKGGLDFKDEPDHATPDLQILSGNLQAKGFDSTVIGCNYGEVNVCEVYLL